MSYEWRADAAAAHALDIEALADLTPVELDDLAHVHELYDPETNGIECDVKRRL